jgi:hypothetical protein
MDVQSRQKAQPFAQTLVLLASTQGELSSVVIGAFCGLEDAAPRIIGGLLHLLAFDPSGRRQCSPSKVPVKCGREVGNYFQLAAFRCSCPVESHTNLVVSYPELCLW